MEAASNQPRLPEWVTLNGGLSQGLKVIRQKAQIAELLMTLA